MPGPSLGVRGVDGTDRVVGDKVDPEGFKNERKILETSLFLQTQGMCVESVRHTLPLAFFHRRKASDCSEGGGRAGASSGTRR